MCVGGGKITKISSEKIKSCFKLVFILVINFLKKENFFSFLGKKDPENVHD